MALTESITAFVAGEVSHSLTSRTDLSKYKLGALTVKNFFVVPTGGLTARSGLQFVGPTRALSDEVQLKKFRATTNDFLLLLWAPVFT